MHELNGFHSPKGLRITIALAYLFMTAFNITFLAIIITDNQVEMLSENTRYRAQEMLTRTSSALKKYTQGFSDAGILGARGTAERIALIDDVLKPIVPSYAIVDANGAVVSAAQSNAVLPEDFAANAKKALTMQEFTGAEYYLAADPSSNRIDFYLPLNGSGLSGMTLFIRNDISAMRDRFVFLYRVIIVMAVAVIIVHFLMAAYVYRLVFAPLSRLLAGTRLVAAGDYSVSIPVKRMDEIGAVSESFNHMSEEVGSAVGKLKQAAAIYERDLAMAVNVQRNILLAEPPAVDGYDVAFYFRPQSGISGDFYDFYHSGKKLDGFLLADVSGHGIASALVTTLAKPIFFRTFRLGITSSLAGVSAAINEALSEAIGDADNYLTAVLARVSDGGVVEYMNAGHTEPVIRRANGQARILPEGSRAQGVPFAFKGFEAQFKSAARTATVELSAGDAFILYTDCLIETKNEAGMGWGVDAIERYLSGLSPQATAKELTAALVSEFDAHTGRAPVKDDLSIVVVKKT